jgi:phospho-N-acetylmuramoyl-pentapeptide-transferase
MGQVLIAGTASLLICVFLSPKFIEFLRDREFGQNIRPEGPEGHHEKAGTPTMGGIILVTAISVPFLVLGGQKPQSLVVYGAAVACAALGFADDWTKIIKRRSLGLRARTKLIVTIVISIGLFLGATKWAGKSEVLRLRLVDYQIDLGVAYVLFVYLVVAGTTSAVNLTDGLDGLCAGTVTIAALTYAAMMVVAFLAHNGVYPGHTVHGVYFGNPRALDLAIIAAALVGGCVGFLWYNAYPADVFMGDTGAFGLGGGLAALAIFTKTEALLVVVGGVFVIEALSVAIQVVSFRMFGKRVFLMAPLHHHFEMMEWTENKIIVRFWIAASMFGASGFVLYYLFFSKYR